MLSTILRIFAAIVAVMATLCGIFLLRRTYIEPWLAIAIGVCGGAVITRMLMRRASAVTGLKNNAIAIAILLISLSGSVFGGFLTMNYAGADAASAHKVQAVIISKRSRGEHPTRRVGRGRYVPDTSRTIYKYYYTLQLPDGHSFEKSVKAERYRRIKTGARETVTIYRGALGWDVIK
ncbi:MAG: hypothetical protein K2L21_01135 [Muribaculaceae bacterium]|nr:hypothetical protein [Muribaculaceae bacterium]